MLFAFEKETWVGGYEHVQPLVYIFQTAMLIEVCVCVCEQQHGRKIQIEVGPVV